jgi:hypothetical protein
VNLRDIVNYNQNCKIYIAGPMTGLPEYNYPKFYEIESLLREIGYSFIFNPAEIANGETGRHYSYYIRESLKMISKADAVVFLNDWENSKGANLEFHAAKLMGLKCWNENLDVLELKKDEHEKSICEIADHLVSFDRQSLYGHPYDNFTDIGRVWGMQLGLPDISPETVGLMMVGVKLSREKFQPKRDNLIDGAGFFKCVDMIHQKKTELNHK